MLGAGGLAGILLLTACGSTRRPPEASVQPEQNSTRQLEKIYRARMDSARSGYTEADVHFMTGMIGHHGQALVMAGFAESHGAGPAVQRLCSRILNAQRDEIKTMQGWLLARNLTVPEIEINGATMMVHGPAYTMHMPGMLSQEQVDELDRARGAEFDRLFLTYMIRHHQGAVTMVHELFATDGAALDGLVFKLASDIQVDQTTEIARMKLMLETLPDRGGRR